MNQRKRKAGGIKSMKKKTVKILAGIVAAAVIIGVAVYKRTR